jgi:hypothetical protein
MPEGQPQGEMTIRVFYVGTFPSQDVRSVNHWLDNVSEVFKVTYLLKLDPIYHELCFVDHKGIRHQFVGLPYHVEEKLSDAGDIDGQA